jgi:hypothetical protein
VDKVASIGGRDAALRSTRTLGALEVLLLIEKENCCEKEDHFK